MPNIKNYDGKKSTLAKIGEYISLISLFVYIAILIEIVLNVKLGNIAYLEIFVLFIPVITAAYSFFVFSQIDYAIKINNNSAVDVLNTIQFTLLSFFSAFLIPGIMSYLIRKGGNAHAVNPMLPPISSSNFPLQQQAFQQFTMPPVQNQFASNQVANQPTSNPSPVHATSMSQDQIVDSLKKKPERIPMICSSCRNIVYSDYEYCPYCGFKLRMPEK